jgi:hypothetical protein
MAAKIYRASGLGKEMMGLWIMESSFGSQIQIQTLRWSCHIPNTQEVKDHVEIH